MRDDAELARAVRRALEWDVRVPDWNIQSAISDGTVTLTGTVKYETQRVDAQRAVEPIAGVALVLNRIEVRPPVRDRAARSTT